LRVGEIRGAVVSTARMNLRHEGQPMAVRNATARLEKVVTKDIGILYYHKSDSGIRERLVRQNSGIEKPHLVSEDFSNANYVAICTSSGLLPV
jgi:hypothetical protein